MPGWPRVLLEFSESSRVACSSRATAQTNIITASPTQTDALLNLKHSLSQIPLQCTRLTARTAGVCRRGSGSQKNIIWNVSYFSVILRNSEFASVGTISSRRGVRWTGSVLSLAKANKPGMCTHTQMKNTSFRGSPPYGFTSRCFLGL